MEAMRAELAVVRSDVSRLGKDRDELVEKVEKLRAEVAKVRGETGKVDEVMWEINCMRNEIERGRYYQFIVVLDINFDSCGMLLEDVGFTLYALS